LINQDYVTKLQKNIDKTYRILSYTKIKPRSRLPQKKNQHILSTPIFQRPKQKKKVRKLRVQMKVNYKFLVTQYRKLLNYFFFLVMYIRYTPLKHQLQCFS